MNDEYSIEEMVDELAELRDLVARPGWKRLLGYAQDAVNQRAAGVYDQSNSIDDLVAKEHPKGMIVGINSIINVPEIKIEELEAKIAEIREGRRDGDEEDEED
jgi:hypothetical protein